MSSERLHSNSRDVSSRPPTDRRGRHLTPHTSHSHQLPSYKILLIALHTNLRLLLANMYFVGISNILTFNIIITTNIFTPLPTCGVASKCSGAETWGLGKPGGGLPTNPGYKSAFCQEPLISQTRSLPHEGIQLSS